MEEQNSQGYLPDPRPYKSSKILFWTPHQAPSDHNNTALMKLNTAASETDRTSEYFFLNDDDHWVVNTVAF